MIGRFLGAALLLAAQASFAAGLEIVSPVKGAVVPLLSDGQKEFLSLPRERRVAGLADREFRRKLRANGHHPRKVKLAWRAQKPSTGYEVAVARKFDGAVACRVTCAETSVEVDNLEIACAYEWTVRGRTADGEWLTACGEFSTEDVAPRLVRIDGVPNVRDLGGRIGLGGRRVRQGLVFRSAGLNDNAKLEIVTNALGKAKKRGVAPGKARFSPGVRARTLERFGFRTDLDLRTDAECFGMAGSPLGSEVKWVHVSSTCYGGMASEHGKAAFAKAFRTFLDESRYPIVFHCISGADRTGSLAYILGALLGYDEETLWRDWEATAFWNANDELPLAHEPRGFYNLVKALDALPGATPAEKAEAYAKSAGFTDADIAKFRSILMPPPVFGQPIHVKEAGDNAMAVECAGNRLYVAAARRLSVFDISRPLEPKLLAWTPCVVNPRQIAVSDGIVYLVSRETGMWIYDFTDLAKPRLRTRYDSVEFATGIEKVGDVVFLSERINGVEFVDVRDPDNPTHIAIRKTEESQSSRYLNGYLYSGEWGVGQVTVFDAHDMRDIREVGRLDLHGFGDGLEIAGGRLYCSTGHDALRRPDLKGDEVIGRGRGLDIFDLSDPARARPVGRVNFPRFLPRNSDFWTVRVACGLAFCADSHNGLFAVDVRDPAKPKLLDRFCVPYAKQPDWPSAAISSLAVGKGCVYVTSRPGGLFVLPVAGVKAEARTKGAAPVRPDFREPYETDKKEFFAYRPPIAGQARTAVVRGDLVEAAFGDAGLHVVRVKEKGGFEKVGELPGDARVLDCCLVGDKLLTAEGADGFALYSLEGPATFREIARRRTSTLNIDTAFWCWSPEPRTIVLTGRTGGKDVYSLDDFASGKPSCSVYATQWDKYLAERAIDGILPTLKPYNSLQWLALEGGRGKVIASDLSFPAGQTCGICDFDGTRFLATFSSHHGVTKDGEPIRQGEFFAFFDPHERKAQFLPIPEVPGFKRFSGVPRSNGRLVACNNRSARAVALFDFSNPAAPRCVKAWKLSGNPDLCAFCGDRVVIPAGHQGLLVTP